MGQAVGKSGRAGALAEQNQIVPVFLNQGTQHHSFAQFSQPGPGGTAGLS